MGKKVFTLRHLLAIAVAIVIALALDTICRNFPTFGAFLAAGLAVPTIMKTADRVAGAILPPKASKPEETLK